VRGTPGGHQAEGDDHYETPHHSPRIQKITRLVHDPDHADLEQST
jgi:hypothetical protein